MANGNAYVEGINWRDTGCDAHPACLSCPLPQCKYEHSVDTRSEARARRDAAIRRDRRCGLSNPQIAAKYHISDRTIYRALSAKKVKQDKRGKKLEADALPPGFKVRTKLPSMRIPT